MTFVQVLQMIAFIPTIYAIRSSSTILMSFIPKIYAIRSGFTILMAFIPKIYAISPCSTIDGIYTKTI